MGGLDLLDLRTESGICSLRLLRDSIFSGSETGKLMLISLHASQLEAGCGFLLLENPAIAISYLTPTWVLSIRQFLYQHNMTVTLTSASLPPLRYQHDKYIMDPDILSRFTESRCRDINLVRLYLQVYTISDLSSGTDGRTICCPYYYRDDRPPNFQTSVVWLRQEKPTFLQQRLWSKYLSTGFLRYRIFWTQRLSNQTKPSPCVLDPLSTDRPRTSYESLDEYL